MMMPSNRKGNILTLTVVLGVCLLGYGVFHFGIREEWLGAGNIFLKWEAESQLKRVKQKYGDIAEWFSAYSKRWGRGADDWVIPKEFTDRLKDDELNNHRAFYGMPKGEIGTQLIFEKPHRFEIYFTDKDATWTIYYYKKGE